MDFLKLFFLLTLTSCSTISYLWEQGIGQWKIQREARDNKEVLNDPKVKDEVKTKIKQVESAKTYFYQYFEKNITDIYSKTTFLNSEAVKYLVIAAPHKKLEAHEFSFPFVGSFPYLGFFNKESALEFQKDLSKDNLVTWMRPVYAYSTLGYFEDRILSSFFYYDEFELAELVFHELFHTIYFIKDEVDMNENFANFFGKEIVKEYYKNDPRIIKYEEKLALERKIDSEMVRLIKLLQEDFDKLGAELTDAKGDELTQRFSLEVFVPFMMKLCTEMKNENLKCRFDKEIWNQASFSALLTYEEEQIEIDHWYKESGANIKDFLKLLEKYQVDFKTEKDLTFVEFLKTKFKKTT